MNSPFDDDKTNEYAEVEVPAELPANIKPDVGEKTEADLILDHMNKIEKDCGGLSNIPVLDENGLPHLYYRLKQQYQKLTGK